MVSCAMPLVPVMMRSPGSTATPLVAAARWPLDFTSVTSPITNVNSPAAAPASSGIAARTAARTRFIRGAMFLMALFSLLDHVAADVRGHLAAVEVEDVDVRAVVRVHVLHAHGAFLAERPRQAQRNVEVGIAAALDHVGARPVVLVLAVDEAHAVVGLQLGAHRVLEVAARAEQVLALGGS